MQDLAAATSPAQERLSQAQYGSDLIVEMFASLDIPYVAFNPGSSYRGLHDSFVNFQTPGMPEMVLCLHEEIAVAVAHGYARVTGKPMLAALHDLVGLQHGSMAIFNAWCDRVPMLVVGGTGPMAPENRRAHIDWVHTALVQGNVVRDIVKWDDQPSSVAAIPESILRAYRIAMTEPSAPVYLCFDVDLQEAPVADPIRLPDPARFAPPAPAGPDLDALRRAADLLAGARYPVILADAIGRHPEAVSALQELAELLGAPVISFGTRFNIASTHPLNVSAAREEVLAKADVLLALDVFDLSGAVSPPISPQRRDELLPADAKVIHIALWDFLQHSLVSDYERLFPVDVPIAADTRIALPMLVEACREALGRDAGARGRIQARSASIQETSAAAASRFEVASRRGWDATPISLDRLSLELRDVVQKAGLPWTFVNGVARGWDVTEPEQVVASGRGSGLGMSAGTAVGSTIAYRDAGRLCINLIGDGDLLYTPGALWTASNLRLPLLTIVNNNRSYGNDEGHQEHVARLRGRPVENKGVGIFIEDPDADFIHIAQGYGVEGFGPVHDPADLPKVLGAAVDAVVKEQRPALVDVRTQRRGG
jgi:thiamine pyrophosphate-dependent acetolactate synthase large subunit-like protein